MSACSFWSEAGNFNQTLISTLKTHIGTPNDTPAWVFLSCISEYFDIEKPEFVMDYYQSTVLEVSLKLGVVVQHCKPMISCYF